MGEKNWNCKQKSILEKKWKSCLWACDLKHKNMSLYDDEDLGAPPTELAVGWSSGLKMMQSQKKPLTPNPRGPQKSTFTPTLNKPRSTFTSPKLAPVIDLKSKRPIEEVSRPKASFQKPDRVNFS